MSPGKKFNVGILGGNFDPIHIGHLLIAQEARRECELAQVLFCPYRQSPRETEREITPAETRLLLVELALQDVSQFQISTLEADREGPSYTVETLEAYQNKHDNWNLHFIIGSDNLKELHTWKEPDRILDLARLFVARRDQKPKKIPKPVMDIVQEKGRDRLIFQSPDGPRMQVSSTMIRERARNRDSIKYLVPKAVREYIEDHNLYKERRKM